MKVEIVEKPSRLSKSNSKWLEISGKFHALSPEECLRITDLSKQELNAVRQQAYREVSARSFQRVESGKNVLYLYKGVK